MDPCTPLCFAYGPDGENQFVRVYHATDLNMATVVIIHGGFWKQKYGVDNSAIETLPAFLQSKGHGVCLIEYRRREHPGGGWPGTNEDILSALQTLFECRVSLNKEKIVIVGHSAGGTLALWVCSKLRERGLPFRPALCVAVAPVGDLEEGYTRRLSDEGDAVMLYMKGAPLHVIEGAREKFSTEETAMASENYRRASPHHLLPIEIPTLIVAAGNDADVPADVVCAFHSQCVRAVQHMADVDTLDTASSLAEPEPRLLVIPHADHYQWAYDVKEPTFFR